MRSTSKMREYAYWNLVVFDVLELESFPLWSVHKGNTCVELLTGLPVDLDGANEHRKDL